MEKARQILERYQAILDTISQAGGDLRFERSAVGIADIAQQHYCEKALQLSYEHPMLPTERMTQGKEGHAAVTSLATLVTAQQAIRDALRVGRAPTCIYDFGVGWKHKGVPILGRIDEVWFMGGSVQLVVERKFTDSLRAFPSHHIQARLYCLGLGEMGFDTSSTKYKLMILKRSCFSCSQLELRTCPIVDGELTAYRCDEGEARAMTFPFEKSKIVRDLDWALDFWLGARRAVPTTKPGKCRVCDYQDYCQESLADAR